MECEIRRDTNSHNRNIEQSGVDWAYIVVIPACTYRLYSVHTCMQLWGVDIELWYYLIGIISQFISYVSVDDLHVLQETIMGISHDKLLIPGLH